MTAMAPRMRIAILHRLPLNPAGLFSLRPRASMSGDGCRRVVGTFVSPIRTKAHHRTERFLKFTVAMHTHLVARARRGTLLCNTAAEACELWRRIASTFPELVALCVMPDHVHLLLPGAPAAQRLARMLSGYARWRNWRDGTRGPVWEPHPAPQPLADDGKHLRRTIRYIHLNPCRSRLVADPLSWPWSTHRDALGLCVRPVVNAVRDGERFHRIVSSDPTVSVVGTTLPVRARESSSLLQVHGVVASLSRQPRESQLTRGPSRTLAVQVARMVTNEPAAQLGRFWRLSRGGLYTALRAPRQPAVSVVLRVLGDPRFEGLPSPQQVMHPWS